jgi:hypothetical protein
MFGKAGKIGSEIVATFSEQEYEAKGIYSYSAWFTRIG